MENIKKNRFNLIDESWVPVADVGRVSLRHLFTDSQLRALGGNPVQKIAVLKLLLAVAQAAGTPKDILEWEAWGPKGVAERCLSYLDQSYHYFWLYGEQPFLQMPAIKKAALQSYGVVQAEVSTGNTTVLTQTQQEQPISDADRALLLLVLMGFALSGKKTDNSVVLSPGYEGKRNHRGRPSSGKAGPALAYMGLLHSFILGKTLWETIWLNLLTQQQVESSGQFPKGVGQPPWEQMPEGEACARADELKSSLMGRLVHVSRFCLLEENGLHYSEGLAHLDYNDGYTDPSVAVDYSRKRARVLWVNPEKRPWRELTGLLSFLSQQSSQGFECLQLQTGIERAQEVTSQFGVWSGGLRVSSNAGEQYVSGGNDFVESEVWLHTNMLGELWFAQLQNEMTALDTLSKMLYSCVSCYFKDQSAEGTQLAAQATQMFWQLCERDFQTLVDHCDMDGDSQKKRAQLRLRFAGYVSKAYSQYCPTETARQMHSWARCRPNLRHYLNQEE